jgi:hypothetical protein
MFKRLTAQYRTAPRTDVFGVGKLWTWLLFGF